MVETSVGQPDSYQCYSLQDGFTRLNEMACGKRGKLLSKQSLVFTAYSQDKLFNGKTKQFYDFLKQ